MIDLLKVFDGNKEDIVTPAMQELLVIRINAIIEDKIELLPNTELRLSYPGSYCEVKVEGIHFTNPGIGLLLDEHYDPHGDTYSDFMERASMDLIAPEEEITVEELGNRLVKFTLESITTEVVDLEEYLILCKVDA